MDEEPSDGAPLSKKRNVFREAAIPDDSTTKESDRDLCCQVFERIARKGERSDCGLVVVRHNGGVKLSPNGAVGNDNSYLLHRISNDRGSAVGGIGRPRQPACLLRDLPSRPSRNAIFDWGGIRLPVLVKGVDELERTPENLTTPTFGQCGPASELMKMGSRNPCQEISIGSLLQVIGNKWRLRPIPLRGKMAGVANDSRTVQKLYQRPCTNIIGGK